MQKNNIDLYWWRVDIVWIFQFHFRTSVSQAFDLS